MNRALVFLAASAAAALAVTSACLASTNTNHDFRADNIHFTLRPEAGRNEVRLSLRTGSDGHSSMSSSFGTSELVGVDPAALRSNGPAPLRFALVRDAGRVDCTGTSRNQRADGDCRFSADPAFSDLLAARGIGRPTAGQSYEMMVVGVRRELVEALHSARYPAPTIDRLTELAAVGIDRRFIDDLAGRGYRPDSLGDLVEFGALDITPAYIDGMARAGFRNMNADAIVQFKALDVTPAYVAELARIGYSELSADEVVELKALDVTPAYVESFARIGYPKLSADTLVQLKALGVTPEYVASLRSRGLVDLTPTQLVALGSFDGHRGKAR